MRLTTTLLLALTLAITALTGAGLLGCTRVTVPDPSEVSSSTAPQAGAEIEPMPVDLKRSLIASSFPVEVPVPDGRVSRGQEQGPDAWDYEIVVDAPASALATWYTKAYSGRNWQLVDQREESGSVSLSFAKGAAESRIDLSEEGKTTRARVVLGVGAPVLQTQ